MAAPLSRRRLLGVAVPGLLAGCFEEPDDAAVSEGGADDVNEAADEAGDGTDGADESGDGTDEGGDATDEDGDATDDGSDGGEGAEDPDDEDPSTPERVDPEDAGITITDAEIVDVSDGGYYTTLTARLTVRNDGRFAYGLLEFRTDAYTTTPNSWDRENVGYEYTTRRFSSDDRFVDGTRQVEVEVQFRSRDASVRSNADWYEVDAAVRRAEPAPE